MDIEKKLIDSVNLKLNQQNAVRASIGAAIWSIPTLALWLFAYQYNPNLGVLMLLASGVIIGVAVRYHGKGMNNLFSFIAFITYVWLSFVAHSLNIILNETIWAFFLFGIFFTGAFISGYLAKITTPFAEHRAHTYLTTLQKHGSAKALKNCWYLALPLLIVALGCTSIATGSFLLIMQESNTADKIAARQSESYNIKKNREIDITPKALASRTNKEMLRYAYAYHSGIIFNKSGKDTQSFPRSPHKANVILKYLVNSRNNFRAMYILGVLTQGSKGIGLINKASDNGDFYAKIHQMVNYGCNTDQNAAINLLKERQQLSQEKYIKDEITSILYVGFPNICSEFEQPEFSSAHIQNYSE